jgi:hypothetical protein
MSKESIEQGFNRRGFLKAAAASAVAAATAGAGAALLKKDGGVISVIDPPALPEPIEALSNIGADVSELITNLATARAENMRLQAQLNSTERRLQTVRQATAAESDSEKAWQMQLDEVHLEVNDLVGRLSVLGGLVALYEQLDEVDLSAVVGEGLSSVGEFLGGIVDDIPSLAEGLEAGRQALAELEEEVPALEGAWLWLGSRIEDISDSYQAVEMALRSAMKVSGTFLHVFSNWVEDVLRWLPFGIGDKTANILDAITNFLVKTPETITGLQENVSRPMNIWLAREDGETRIQRKLIKPVREKALNRAAGTVNQVKTLDVVYRQQLVEPVANINDHRQAIKDSIIRYRQTYSL